MKTKQPACDSFSPLVNGGDYRGKVCCVCGLDEADHSIDDYKRKEAKINNALDECGIGHDVQEKFREGNAAIAAFVADFQNRAMNQLAHNLLVNVPHGIQHEDAIRMAAVGAISALVKWDIAAAINIAADIAEDVNAHSEAAKIREMAFREV